MPAPRNAKQRAGQLYSANEERVVRREPDSTHHSRPTFCQRQIAPDGTTIEERFQLRAGGRNIGEIVRSGGIDQTLFFHIDHLGSVGLITNAAGEVTEQQFVNAHRPADELTVQRLA